MARMPGAEWKPLGDATQALHQPLMSRYDGIVLHTAVGSLISTWGYFAHANGEAWVGTESHFIVGGYGEVWQITDTARTADANLDGNSRLLSIETADTYAPFPKWTGSDVPAWTDDQVSSLARIVAWAAMTHGFPLVRMKDSKPTTRGVGYHRLGIDPWRVSGGERWSTTAGKVCPGDRRIAQVNDVIALAASLSKQPQPPKMPLLDAWQHGLGDAIRAMDDANEAGDTYVKGHEQQKELVTLNTANHTDRDTWSQRWHEVASRNPN